MPITSFSPCRRPLLCFTLCILLLHCLLSRVSADNFPWGRFSDDQVRQVNPEPRQRSPSTVSPLTALPRLNDLNGINRNFTANRGAFGFRKPKKSKQESKPAVSKLSAAQRTKHAKRIAETKHVSKF